MRCLKFNNKYKVLIVLSIVSLLTGTGIIGYIQYGNSANKSNLNTVPDTSYGSDSTLKVGTASTQQSVSKPVSETNNGADNATNPSAPQNSYTTTQTSKPYTAGSCTDTPIPYKTVYETNPYLANGTQRVRQEGKDGYRTTCTPDSNGKQVLAGYTYPGYDKIIETGTYVAPTAPTYQPPKNYSQCSQFSGTGAYQACIDAVNRQ